MSTTKQIKAAVKTLENLRKSKPESIKAVLKAAGYSDSVAEAPSQVTRSKGFREVLEPLMERHNVTREQYIKNIGDAMVATKFATVEGDFYDTGLPDHQTRLSANKQAEKLLELEPKDEKDKEANQELARALENNVDEVELQRVIFKKGV